MLCVGCTFQALDQLRNAIDKRHHVAWLKRKIKRRRAHALCCLEHGDHRLGDLRGAEAAEHAGLHRRFLGCLDLLKTCHQANLSRGAKRSRRRRMVTCGKALCYCRRAGAEAMRASSANSLFKSSSSRCLISTPMTAVAKTVPAASRRLMCTPGQKSQRPRVMLAACRISRPRTN